MSETNETPGQQAARLIREADVVLADPTKSQYHQRLREARDKMQESLDWWTELAIALRESDPDYPWDT